MVAPLAVAIAGVLAVVGGAAVYRCCWRSSTSLSKKDKGDEGGALTRSVEDILNQDNPYSKNTHEQTLVFRRTSTAQQVQAVGS